MYIYIKDIYIYALEKNMVYQSMIHVNEFLAKVW